MGNPGTGNSASITPDSNSEGRENVWYLSASHKGFTSDPEQAMKDLTGVPILCAGNMRLLLQKQERMIGARFRNAEKSIWTYLLDLMEQKIEADHEGNINLSGHIESSILAVQNVLAMMNYPEDYAAGDDRLMMALSNISDKAENMYEQESE